MMGRQDEPAQLFYRFSLDRHVPAGHLLRQIDAVLDLSTIRRTLRIVTMGIKYFDLLDLWRFLDLHTKLLVAPLASSVVTDPAAVGKRGAV